MDVNGVYEPTLQSRMAGWWFFRHPSEKKYEFVSWDYSSQGQLGKQKMVQSPNLQATPQMGTLC